MQKEMRIVDSHTAGEPTGPVRGDIPWGGNWFYLVEQHGHEIGLSDVDELTRVAKGVAAGWQTAASPGNGAMIDHIELFSPTDATKADARNFVLCRGDAYDRSPSGTGTSAKLACFCADGKLAAGEPWWQASIIGSVFRGLVGICDRRIHPFICGAAHVTLRRTLVIDEDDPLACGIGGTMKRRQ